MNVRGAAGSRCGEHSERYWRLDPGKALGGVSVADRLAPRSTCRSARRLASLVSVGGTRIAAAAHLHAGHAHDSRLSHDRARSPRGPPPRVNIAPLLQEDAG
jgi:hypothetical protein